MASSWNGGFSRGAAVSALVLALVVGLAPSGLATPVDINPDVSDNSNANASTGGRVNHMAAVPGDNQTFYLASEYGGVFKSTNGGSNWSRLDGHLPVVAWDVEVDPSNTNRLYASSWYDGRVDPLSGIQLSTDAGVTWTHPATSWPDPSLEGTTNDNTPAGFTCANARRTEPSAFGIAIRPDAANNVFVGTNCGLAISTNSGATWSFVDPTPATAATNIWAVSAQGGGPSGQGIIDVCGDDGHWRTTNLGATWTGGSATIPGGRCSIAASPDESYVLFIVASDNNMYESDDAGATWTNLGNQGPQGRIPFVVTNQRSDDGDTDRFDLWYADTQLFRADCTTPAAPAQGGATRCPTSASWSNQQAGAHWDGGDLLFDTEAGNDACPLLFSSDGGVHTNTVTGSPGCHSPTWTRSNPGYHGLWLWTMDGEHRAGTSSEDLYFGTQDNGTFATTNAGAGSPTWTNPNCCDTFDMLAGPDWALGTTCCFNTGRFNRLQLAGPGYSSPAEINTYPAGTIPGFTWGYRLAQFGDDSVALITSSGVFTTTDIEANPITWTQLPAVPATGGRTPCSVRASVDSASNPVFFVQAGQCTGRGLDEVYRVTGTGSGGSWTRIDNTDGLAGGFGVFAVDPNDDTLLYASHLGGSGPEMVLSTDGGTTWQGDPELDDLMTGGGVFKYVNSRGPSTNRGGAGAVFQGYPQPTLLAFDPEVSGTLVAGGADSGVFLSVDGGDNWSLVTDPINPAASGKAHLPRPRYAYFDHDPAGTTTVFVGTQGRGVWRLAFRPPTADAGGPYATVEGTDVTLDASGSTDPDGQPLTYAWDLDGDGEYDDATGPAPVFDLVGQDGAYPVSVKATDTDGGYDTASATVTVGNVAPTVSAVASGTPADEGTALTVSGVVTDPGWLEQLTLEIDWGDGELPEAVGGTLDNDRPDAALTFSVEHVYGDNGTFTATVCGRDDDTQTCQALSLEVLNVDPTAEIDLSGATIVNGTPTIIAHAGESVDLAGRSTDPGSDDLDLAWDFGDGSPAVSVSSLVNPPDPDPPNSPSVQPRDVTDLQVHTWADACMYTLAFTSDDDDGGSAATSADVLITGNEDGGKPTGYWTHQYRRDGKTDFSDDELECYLAIVDHVSVVFHGERDASTIPKAHAVLFEKKVGVDKHDLLDRALLTAWLNFANGAVGYDELVDTDGDGIQDTAFSVAMTAAEAVRLDPSASAADLDGQREIVQRINSQI